MYGETVDCGGIVVAATEIPKPEARSIMSRVHFCHCPRLVFFLLRQQTVILFFLFFLKLSRLLFFLTHHCPTANYEQFFLHGRIVTDATYTLNSGGKVQYVGGGP